MDAAAFCVGGGSGHQVVAITSQLSRGGQAKHWSAASIYILRSRRDIMTWIVTLHRRRGIYGIGLGFGGAFFA